MEHPFQPLRKQLLEPSNEPSNRTPDPPSFDELHIEGGAVRGLRRFVAFEAWKTVGRGGPV